MSLTIEDARAVADMRLKLVQNMKADLAPETGIDKDEMKRILEIVRHDRSIGDATGSKAKAKAPMIPIDLEAFKAK